MKHLKRLLALFTGLLVLTQLSSASSSIKLKVNGKYLTPDAPPFITNSSTYVPIRFISEALNIDNIKWDASSKSVTIKDKNTTVVLFVNKNYAYINNEYTQLTNNALISNSRTFVPIRFIAECFNTKVNWDKSSQTVIISSTSSNNNTTSGSSNSTIDSTTSGNNNSSNNSSGTTSSSNSNSGGATSSGNNNSMTPSDYNDAVYWLARIVEAEAGGEPFKGKVAVGEVILNRVESDEFPNTIWGVIFDDKFGIQFEPVANGTIYNTPSSESIKAAKTALNGSNYIGNCLYFLNPTIAQSNWITKNREYYTTISNHEFYV